MQTIPFSDFIGIDETTLWLLGIVSLITFISTLIIVPWLIVRIPPDYFASKRGHVPALSAVHPVVRWLMLIAKNLLGGVLISMGILMLVLPGQGLLTILIGFVLLNFPGKYRLERWLVLRRPVLRSVNWLRRRGGHKPLVFE